MIQHKTSIPPELLFSKTQLTALWGSIEKWSAICLGTGIDQATENCTLCQNYFDANCANCPIFISTGQTGCVGTPYDRFYTYFDQFETFQLETSPQSPQSPQKTERRIDPANPLEYDLAWAELEFLVDLTPEPSDYRTPDDQAFLSNFSFLISSIIKFRPKNSKSLQYFLWNSQCGEIASDIEKRFPNFDASEFIRDCKKEKPDPLG